jgi:hypothetical protein
LAINELSRMRDGNATLQRAIFVPRNTVSDCLRR